MLLMVTFIMAILAGWLFYKNHNRWGACALILLIACQALLILDAAQHFGTRQRIGMSIEKIAPIADIKGNKVMITEKIKRGKTVFTAYAAKELNSSKIITILNEHKRVKVDFNANGETALQMTQNDKYNYTNHVAELLYSGVTNNNQLKRQTITYQLTPDWHLLSKKELKNVVKALKTKSTRQKIRSYVTGRIKQQLQNDPRLASNKQKLQQLENTYVKEYINGLMNKAANRVP